jgi:hypothetical protein
MRGYSLTDHFHATEIEAWRTATRLVEELPDPFDCKEIRCHELARALGAILDLPYEDGLYGAVNHSWLWTKSKDNRLRSVLDVYSVGSLPLVQLKDVMTPCLMNRELYRYPRTYTDINEGLVITLIDFFRSKL